jgi:hypothetical protein
MALPLDTKPETKIGIDNFVLTSAQRPYKI